MKGVLVGRVESSWRSLVRQLVETQLLVGEFSNNPSGGFVRR